MEIIEKIEKQIKNTLGVEKENALQYASSISEADDNNQGWIEALEYVLDTIDIIKRRESK
tara:strand:+ start:3820 stop:3999 length:180 start_codon:yes stop_codon:yes gene_type:complete